MPPETGADRQSQFLVLYNRAQPLLRGYLFAWLRDFHRAEEILQQTSLELWEHFAEYDAARPFSAWALGIARNQALKELRRSKAAPELARPEVLDAVAGTYAALGDDLALRRRVLQGCVEKLSAALRALVDLYYGRGLSIAEVAAEADRPRGSVEVSLFRARQQLADCTRKALAEDHP
ncbi:MAG TPA: sigma-70 family RNA polymerase sigma factor [Planctomycetota bacterium]|nr:sigma-70 family RNA polymerase sigma factor [Planctomycetota bacterium]